MKNLIFIICIFFTSFFAYAENSTVSFKNEVQEWNYHKLNIQGWDVFIEQSISKDKMLFVDLKKQLAKDLKDISLFIPSDNLAFLKTVNIWASNESNYPLRKGEKGVVPYHKSKQWLINHGMNPAMENGVHIINPSKVLYHHKIFDWGPMTILHELSHAFHYRKLGLDNEIILKAYQNAIEKKLYDKIPSRSNPRKRVKAYAATNSEEYFAELSEAYFGNNDYFPKTRIELKRHDPIGYKMIEESWGIRLKK